MPTSVVMPALEMAQETGKLISWLKKEGDAVSKGELLLEIETDKAVMEIESPADGVLAGVRAQAGAEVPVGQTIAWIVNPGEAAPDEPVATSTGRRTDPARTDTPVETAPAVHTDRRDVRVSPKARRLAKEHNVDLATVRGTGQGGEVLAADVLAAAANSATLPTAPSSAGVETLSPVSRLMAERTAQSWTSVPHFFVTRECQATNLNAVREALLPRVEKAHGLKVTHTDLLLAVVARTLTHHPRINASWMDNGIRTNPEIHIALATAVDDGVVAAVVHHANRLRLEEIAMKRRDLAERARAGRLRPADIADATFTISNLGMLNVDSFSAIISPPQAAILAVGRIRDRVVPYQGRPAILPMLSLTLSSDHRVIDGARAARFMNDLVVALESVSEKSLL